MAADQETQWETIAEESGTRIIFDTIGDQFEGTYLATTLIEPDGSEAFKQQRFRGADGGIYVTNGGYKLREAFDEIPGGAYVRITYVADIDVGRSAPMKDFRVETRK